MNDELERRVRNLECDVAYLQGVIRAILRTADREPLNLDVAMRPYTQPEGFFLNIGGTGLPTRMDEEASDAE